MLRFMIDKSMTDISQYTKHSKYVFFPPNNDEHENFLEFDRYSIHDK